jgi:hypothetical protein
LSELRRIVIWFVGLIGEDGITNTAVGVVAAAVGAAKELKRPDVKMPEDAVEEAGDVMARRQRDDGGTRRKRSRVY